MRRQRWQTQQKDTAAGARLYGDMKIKVFNARHGQARRLFLREDPSRIKGLATDVAPVPPRTWRDTCGDGAPVTSAHRAVRRVELAEAVHHGCPASFALLRTPRAVRPTRVEVAHDDRVDLRQGQRPSVLGGHDPDSHFSARLPLFDSCSYVL